jgi:hypothetical protein
VAGGFLREGFALPASFVTIIVSSDFTLTVETHLRTYRLEPLEHAAERGKPDLDCSIVI